MSSQLSGVPLNNPYSSPPAKPASISALRLRRYNLFSICFLAGIVAAMLVYAGDSFNWPQFNRRAGFLGTEFISDFLYAINDPYAIHVVAFLWFLYAAIATAILLHLSRFLSYKT